MSKIICPCCESELIYQELPNPSKTEPTHVWKCSGDTCPIVMFEYVDRSDYDILGDNLK